MNDSNSLPPFPPSLADALPQAAPRSPDGGPTPFDRLCDSMLREREPVTPARPVEPLRFLRSGESGAGDSAAECPHPSRLFSIGRNCFTVARARQVALLVDGDDYFHAFTRAAEQAERSICILAWDFDSRTRLDFSDGEDMEEHGAPRQLGDFLNWLARRRRDLNIHVLNWDYPMVFGTDRELPPRLGFGWRPHRRVHVAYDNTHPVTASHHQKIVVIDDDLAFIGGFDLTVRRWDSCAHRPDDPRRNCDGKPYPPFHDVMMAVDGDAARALGRIARSRWLAATGESLPAVRADAPRWPDELPVALTGVDVAFARTLPPGDDRPAVTEVEQLYLDMIAAARRHLYIESQYFTAASIGEALAARLEEPDGPEIVVVVRLFSHGWLEEHTMHVLRTRLVQRLRAADRHGRFHIHYPHIDGLADKVCLDLHSKLMIVDDEILRIGSANLSNRSMGMDSECDAAIEAQGDPAVSDVIRGFRNRLLGEHLDVPPAEFDAAMRRHGTLAGAIDELAGAGTGAGRSRTLRPLEKLPDWPGAVIELARVGDPAQPVTLDRLIEAVSPELLPADDGGTAGGAAARAPSPRRRWPRSNVARMVIPVALVLVLLALAAVWRYTPLAELADAGAVAAWAHEVSVQPWAPLLILIAYTPACVLMFPRPLITLAAVVAFGPELGFVYALSGILIAALATYVAGLWLPRRTVRNLAGRRLPHIAGTLRRRGLLAVTALRLVPIAPFAVEGVVAAAIGIRLSPFLLGTLFGMLPGTLATTIFGDQLEAALTDPARIDYVMLATISAGILLLSLVVRHWLVAEHRTHQNGENDSGHR